MDNLTPPQKHLCLINLHLATDVVDGCCPMHKDMVDDGLFDPPPEIYIEGGYPDPTVD